MLHLRPILHGSSQGTYYYHFWQFSRASVVSMIPPLTHSGPQTHTSIQCAITHSHLFSTVCRLKGQGLGMKGGTKSVKVKKEARLRRSVGTLKTIGHVPGHTTGVCLIWNTQLITLGTSVSQRMSTTVYSLDLSTYFWSSNLRPYKLSPLYLKY